MKKCKIVLLDEANCALLNLSEQDLKYFWKMFGYKSKKAIFSKKYKIGKWDGYIRFFQKSGKTYINLLDEIYPILIEKGYKVVFEDKRKVKKIITPPPVDENFFSDVIDPRTNKPWKMRKYQVDLVNTLLSKGFGVGIAGTGSGKTSMCAAIAKSYEKSQNFRSIIIVPDKTLTDQTYENYKMFNLDVGKYGGGEKSLDHKHIVATWQSLQHNPYIISDFDVIIVDECHGLRGEVLKELLNKYGKDVPLRFGVTGTMPKEKDELTSVIISVGKVQYEVPASDLMEQGFLTKVDIKILQYKIDLQNQYQKFLKEVEEDDGLKAIPYTKFKNNFFPDFSSEKRFLQTHKKRTDWIKNYIYKTSLTGNVLCLVNGIDFGKKLAKEIPGAYFLYGQHDVKERKEIYSMFEEKNDMIVIATINIAGTGLDIPRIFNLVLIDVGKSFVRVIQSIGRSLRLAEGKNVAKVHDICSDLKFSKKHMRTRISYYDEVKYPYNIIKVEN